jgi:hypothetical protein
VRVFDDAPGLQLHTSPLEIAFYGGSYSDRVALRPQQEYVPKYILAAAQEAH